MAVTVNQIRRIDRQSVRFDFSTDESAPLTFTVFRDRKIIDKRPNTTSTTGAVDVHVDPDETVTVEITDDANQRPKIAFPGRVKLPWQQTGASWYRIEEKISGVWTARQTLPAAGREAYTWTTRFLEDGQQHEFRVVPIDADLTEGTAKEYTFTLRRIPDVPNLNETYNPAAGTVTFTAAD